MGADVQLLEEKTSSVPIMENAPVTNLPLIKKVMKLIMEIELQISLLLPVMM